MKTLFFVLCCLNACYLFGQTANNRQDHRTTFENYLGEVYGAYEKDAMSIWNYYTDESGEIYPDGSMLIGKEKLVAGFEEFQKMVDGQPTFTYQLTSWRLLTPDVALVTWDTNSDVKIQGQQVGGPARCLAVLRKVKGKWMIEFDTMTPIVQMPGN